MLTASPDFATYGAQRFKGSLKPCMGLLEAALSTLRTDEAGVRLHGLKPLAPLLASNGCIGGVAASVLGPRAKPVRAILFNKSGETNWSLGWHQDRTICVKERREAPGFGPWTVKGGMVHVAPPFELLSRMVTLRAHLDDVPSSNAPLLIAPGSHTFGRIAVEDVDQVVRQCAVPAGNGCGTVRGTDADKSSPSKGIERLRNHLSYKSVFYRDFRKRSGKIQKTLNHSHSMVPGGFEVTS